MFGRSYCIISESYNYHLDYREYVSDDEWSLRITSGDGEWSGNVYDFYIRVMNSLKTVTGRRMAIDDDMRRVEDTQLDKCMREMLVNALVNVDYRGRGEILVEWRPRSFSVRNCGTFRIPLETAMAGGISDPRNQTMATMFSLIGAVERNMPGAASIAYCPTARARGCPVQRSPRRWNRPESPSACLSCRPTRTRTSWMDRSSPCFPRTGRSPYRP